MVDPVLEFDLLATWHCEFWLLVCFAVMHHKLSISWVVGAAVVGTHMHGHVAIFVDHTSDHACNVQTAVQKSILHTEVHTRNWIYAHLCSVCAVLAKGK